VFQNCSHGVYIANCTESALRKVTWETSDSWGRIRHHLHVSRDSVTNVIICVFIHKYYIKTYNLCNPNIPGLGQSNPGISGLVKNPASRDPGIAILNTSLWSWFPQQREIVHWSTCYQSGTTPCLAFQNFLTVVHLAMLTMDNNYGTGTYLSIFRLVLFNTECNYRLHIICVYPLYQHLHFPHMLNLSVSNRF